MTRLQRFEEAMANNALAGMMSQRGWAVREEKRLAHSKRLELEIAEAKAKFVEVTGVKFNTDEADDEDDEVFDEKLFSSAPQLKVLYFDKFGVQPRYWSKETGKASLNKNMLKDLLADGMTPQIRESARWLLRFREAHKTKATYIDRLSLDHPKTYLSKHDGLLHPNWQVAQALTARWSCSGPNLQNLQKPVFNDKKQMVRPGTRDVLMAKDWSRTADGVWVPGLWLIEGDYAQLELRIIALLAGDPVLIEMFASKGVDMHMENAKILFGTATPTKTERELAKTFVYGSNYGGSARTIWKQLVTKFPNITENDVKIYQDRWFKAHPWIKAFTQGCYRLAKEKGVLKEYLSGREFVFYLRQVKQTEPANYMVQGFAASMMNHATTQLAALLDWENREAMLAQIHDSAFLEGPDPVRLAKLLKGCMEQEIKVGEFTMRFDIDMKVGMCWGEMIDLPQAKGWFN